MKKTLIALTATAAMSVGSIALADETQGPIVMTDAQMDQIVAGGTWWNIQNPGIDKSFQPSGRNHGRYNSNYQSTSAGTQVRICISDTNTSC